MNEKVFPAADPSGDAVDRLLRQSLAAPFPSLLPDFEQRVMREVRRSSGPIERHRQILLTGYGIVSVVVSAVVMRGQGLGWTAIAGMILAPLSLIAFAHAAWPVGRPRARNKK